MAKNNEKMVDQITSMDVDFGQWYTDVVKKAELADYSGVKGCMIFRPYGYAIWENIQKDLDARFKALSCLIHPSINSSINNSHAHPTIETLAVIQLFT